MSDLDDYFNKQMLNEEFHNEYSKLNCSIYVISDTHFGHKNIIEYCNRPFKSVEEMDLHMITQWNKTVTDNDIIIHLGDFAFGTSEEIRNYASQLNGKKILVQGNHDRKGVGFFEGCGFTVWKKGSLLPIIKNGITYPLFHNWHP